MSPTEPNAETLRAITQAVAEAQRVLFITGAGMSAESGLPTYRGVGGLYNQPDTPEGLPIEALLSGRCMAEQPATCWKYLGEVEAACRGAQPNPGHQAIAALEAHVDRVVVLTQNVDGLHTAAGSTDVIEIHGNLHRLRCTGCGWRKEVTDYAGLRIPPRCPECGELVRPDVVLFGEMLPMVALNALEQELREGFDVVFSIGTTSVFPYIAEPVIRAGHHRRMTVEINPGDTEVSHLVHHRIRAEAGPVLQRILGDVLRYKKNRAATLARPRGSI